MSLILFCWFMVVIGDLIHAYSYSLQCKYECTCSFAHPSLLSWIARVISWDTFSIILIWKLNVLGIIVLGYKCFRLVVKTRLYKHYEKLAFESKGRHVYAVWQQWMHNHSSKSMLKLKSKVGLSGYTSFTFSMPQRKKKNIGRYGRSYIKFIIKHLIW